MMLFSYSSYIIVHFYDDSKITESMEGDRIIKAVLSHK